MSRTAITEKNLIMGERIKTLRTERKITQENLGEVIGVQRSAIRKYEKGEVVNPPTSTIKTLAEYFNVSTDYLLGKTEWRSEEERVAKSESWNETHNENGKLAQKVTNMERFIVQLAQSGGGQLEFGKYLQLKFGSAALELLEAFAKLNEQGKTEAVKRVDEMLNLDQYRAEPENGSR